jgi:hypothetical protein
VEEGEDEEEAIESLYTEGLISLKEELLKDIDSTNWMF